MGLSIYLFAGPDDYKTLSQYFRQLGLRTFPCLMSQPEEQEGDDPADFPFGYLSPLPREELHPYGNPPGIGEAIDPLLQILKPHFQNDKLVIGRIYCTDDVPRYCHITKPLIAKIARWLKKEWQRLPTGQYIGPHAKELELQGAQLVYFPRGMTTIERKYI